MLATRKQNVVVPSRTTPATTQSSLHRDNESFFDVFSIPDPPSPRDPSAFDKTASEQYLELLNPILKDDKFRKLHTTKPIPLEVAEPVMAWLQKEEPAVLYDLPALKEALQAGVTVLDKGDHGVASTDTTTGSTTLDGQLQLQRDRFCEEMGFSLKQWLNAQGALYQLTNHCSRQAAGLPTTIIWEKVKEAGFRDKGLLNNLLYISSTFSVGNRRKRTRYARLVGLSILDIIDDAAKDRDAQEEEEEEDVVDTTDEIAIYHDLLYEPTEQSVNVRIKLLVAQGNAKQAERLIDQHSDQLRLRAYAPVLRLYLELNDTGSALTLFRRMQDMPLVHLDEETYVHVLAVLAEKGCFHPQAPSIQGAVDYQPASGPRLLDQIASQMAKEIIEISTASAKRLYNALADGFPNSELEKTSSLAPLKLSETRAKKDEVIASRVRIDPSIGDCPRSGRTLRLIHLEETEREHLQESILALSRTVQLDFHQKQQTRTSKPPVRADDGLSEFLKSLAERDGEPFTAIVDGPNVGYYMQNFESGKFSFHQIKFLVDSLERMGERPLVVLPQKYTRKYFMVSIGYYDTTGPRRQYLTAEELAIRDELIQSGKVYVVPQGFLDDFYWILASIADQTKSRKGKSLYVAPDNPAGRWPGARPILLSNDQMRDHKIGMMEPMLFRRWHSNFIVNYNFAAFVDGECPHPEIGFRAADAFSREIQGNPMPDGSVALHFPIQETDDEWFCIRIPTTNGE
jgi:hypothetical protein